MLILWLLQPLVRSLKEQLSVNDAIGCSQPGDSTPPAGGTGCSKGGSLPPVRELAAAKGAACHQSGNWLQQRGQHTVNRRSNYSPGVQERLLKPFPDRCPCVGDEKALLHVTDHLFKPLHRDSEGELIIRHAFARGGVEHADHRPRIVG